jgi:hypothetical protein
MSNELQREADRIAGEASRLAVGQSDEAIRKLAGLVADLATAVGGMGTTQDVADALRRDGL